jgi:hypothetical protein
MALLCINVNGVLHLSSYDVLLPIVVDLRFNPLFLFSIFFFSLCLTVAILTYIECLTSRSLLRMLATKKN